MRGVIFKLVVLAILITGALSVKWFILQGVPVVSIKPAPPLTGQISQAFTTPSATLPRYGIDYVLQNTHYFENGQWVVTSIQPKSKNITSGLIVLHQKDGVFLTALGPGTSFPKTSTENLPASVGLYLYGLGAVYEPVESNPTGNEVQHS